MDSATNADYHPFRFGSAEIRRYFPEAEFSEVIATEAFRRLESIHFLGSIDYLLEAGQRDVESRHTRYEHSLSVAFLANRFAKIKGVSGDDYINIGVAALLHDIGHAPLSHSFEPSFRSLFDVDHHVVGERIIRGEVRLGRRLSRVFSRHGINNFEIMSIISGKGRGVAKDIFSRSINVDTIEGIIRSASYTYRSVILSPIAVLDALANLGEGAHEILDEFWLLKDKIYSGLIQSNKGLVADYLCTKYMRMYSDDFSAALYMAKERDLKASHISLFDALKSLGRMNKINPDLVADGENLTYTKRRFFIDKSVVLRNYADLDRRYLQEKTQISTSIKKTGGEIAHGADEHFESCRLF
jgi:HD superfamily phosphohydrolase